jgi:SAM-dependent methyltransferase
MLRLPNSQEVIMDTSSTIEQEEAAAGLRRHLHGMWAAVAPAWGEHADYADLRGAEVTDRLLELARPAAGERVLELACGAGGLGLTAAERVGPGGTVVLSDVAAEMTAIAATRAAACGVRNVTTRELDLEDIEAPDGAFDLVLCREGLMFAVDPARALREIRRVLAPGGRVAVAVWGPRERNPWLGLVLDAAGEQLGAPVPPPGIPGPFALSDAGRLAGLLAGSGLTEVAVEELAVPLRAGSFDEWWDRTSALAGPLAQLLETLPPAATQDLRRRARALVDPYMNDGALELPGVTLLASGRVA